MRPTKIIASLLCLIAWASSCVDDPVVKDDTFQLENTRSYAIESTPGFSVEDPVSGCTFSFPQGGSGDLTVSTITDGPGIDGLTANRFMLGYNAKSKIDLLVPIDNQYVQAFVYGTISGASVKPNIGEHHWSVMLEQDTVDGKLRFEIGVMPLKTGTSKYIAPTSSYFAVSKMSKTSSDFLKLATFYQSIHQIIGIWLEALTKEEQDAAYALMADKMKYDVRLASSNYYQHFNNWVWGKNAVFFLQPTVELHSMAHETGHYMTHLFCGYEKYNAIYKAMPTNYWGLGGSIDHIFGMYIEGRKYLLEEYAHFSEFLIKGTVEDHDMYNVADINFFSQVIAADPALVDYPSHEGFGAAMMTAVMRTEDHIHTFDKTNSSKVEVPVVGASLGDIIRHVIKKGPVTVNELYVVIEQYLTARGNAEVEKLPAILEPLGWSYTGRGILLDLDSLPIKDARVRPVVSAGKEYHGPLSDPTNEKGEFKVKRLPPGNSILRVYYHYEEEIPQDSTDIEIGIDHELKTNAEINLGKRTVMMSEKLVTTVQSKILDTRIEQPWSGVTGPTITSNMDLNYQIIQSARNKINLSTSFLSRTDVSALITLNIYCLSKSRVKANMHVSATLSAYNWVWEYINQTDRISSEYLVQKTPAVKPSDYGQGAYEPAFSWSQNTDGSVDITLDVDPETLFSGSEDVRKYRLDFGFPGTTKIKLSSGSTRTDNYNFSPGSMLVFVNKQY